MVAEKLLIYVLRRDLRVADNPIFHHLSSRSDHGFSHLLPLFVFPRLQIETSGFLKDGEQSPYPPAVSSIGKFWRCGPHRAKFLAQSVWDLKENLVSMKSDLTIRVGEPSDVIDRLIRHFKETSTPVGAVWMTEDIAPEEIQEQDTISSICSTAGVEFKLWQDEKYFIDARDTGLKTPKDLPDVFTTYRKSQEPLREKPRKVLPALTGTLPGHPKSSSIPSQHAPFTSVESLSHLEDCLCAPLKYELPNQPVFPKDAKSAHPFRGGERPAMERLTHLIKSGAMQNYASTRNGLLGEDFSTKLSAYLAVGCISARQVHQELVNLEDGVGNEYVDAKGFGHGENDGTKAVRLELLWRDYMQLCTRKFGIHLFLLSGFRQESSYNSRWKTLDKSTAPPNQKPSPEDVGHMLDRVLNGTTGMGLIDAAQRELFLTGYASNRARQNVASFLTKHLQIDWRYGAEWYESFLIDYDVSSNWANWQYVGGIGNDPRGDARIFNPVKQAFDYDKDGSYVRTWVPEVKDLESSENVFQPWTTSQEDLAKYGLANSIMVTDPLKRIEFTVDRKPRGNRRPYSRGRGRGGSNSNRGGNPGYGLNMVPGGMQRMGSMASPPTSPQMYATVNFDGHGYHWNGGPPMAPHWHHANGPPGHYVHGDWGTANGWYGDSRMHGQVQIPNGYSTRGMPMHGPRGGMHRGRYVG